MVMPNLYKKLNELALKDDNGMIPKSRSLNSIRVAAIEYQLDMTFAILDDQAYVALRPLSSRIRHSRAFQSRMDALELEDFNSLHGSPIEPFRALNDALYPLYDRVRNGVAGHLGLAW